MKKITLILASFLISAAVYGQDIFKDYGIKEPLTLSKGRFVERFPVRETVQIGTVLYNTKTREITEFLEEETTVYAYFAELSTRWLSPDPLAAKFPEWSPYVYCNNNPIIYVDPTGEYPVLTITKEKTGQTVDQRVLHGGAGTVITQVDLYKATLTDTEDASVNITFSVTRDAWVIESGGGSTASNVGFEPKDGNINHFSGKIMSRGYPDGNGTEALKLTQSGSEVVHAESNNTAVNIGSRDKSDVAKGIMVHVGGNYERGGQNAVAASLGCFGIVNPNNSDTNQANSYSNNIINTAKNQAEKSQTNPGHIRIIIQKRDANEYPQTKTVP